MKRFRVNVPAFVENQILDQMLYIAEDSVENAIRWEMRLRNAIHRLGEAPYGCPIDPVQSRYRKQPVRRFVFERTYRVFYHVDETTLSVVVTDFEHGARRRRRR